MNPASRSIGHGYQPMKSDWPYMRRLAQTRTIKMILVSFRSASLLSRQIRILMLVDMQCRSTAIFGQRRLTMLKQPSPHWSLNGSKGRTAAG